MPSPRANNCASSRSELLTAEVDEESARDEGSAGAGDVCAICLDALDAPLDRCVALPGCTHLFHAQCVRPVRSCLILWFFLFSFSSLNSFLICFYFRPWLATRNCCPTCKQVTIRRIEAHLQQPPQDPTAPPGLLHRLRARLNRYTNRRPSS